MNKSICTFTMLFLVLTWSACTNHQKSLEQSIRNIEKSDSATTDGGLNALQKLYIDFAMEYPEASQSPLYLHKAAMHAFLKSDYVFSRDLSLRYVQQYPKGLELAPTLLNLARIYYYGIYKPDSSIYYFKKAGEIRTLAQIDLQELASATSSQAEKSMGAASVDLYFEAANLFQKAGASLNAIHCLNKGISISPEHPKSANSLQTIAFIFENELTQPDSAVRYYQRLIKEYPDSEPAKQAEYLVKNNLVGKSAEEILEFGLKNQKKAGA